MLLKRNAPATGICFAWLPVQTPEGKVWLELVRFKWQDHGFGGWSYERRRRRYTASDWWRSLPIEERIRLRNEIADETMPRE